MRPHPYAVKFIEPIGDSIISVACTPNFSLVVAGAVDRNIHVLNDEGKKIWSHRLDHEVWCTAVSADGRRIAAGTADKKPAAGSIYIFDSKETMLLKESIDAPVWSVALSADGAKLIASGWNGKVYLFCEENGDWRKCAEASIAEYGAYGVSISDDGNTIAAVSYSDAIYFFDSKLKVVQKVEDGNLGYRTRLTADGKKNITGLRNGGVKLLNRNTQEGITKIISQRPICAVGVTPSAKLCAAGGFDGTLHVLTDDLNILWKFRTQGEVWATDISYDGRYICIASGDGKLYGIENYVTDAALEEILLLESYMSGPATSKERSDVLKSLLQHYLRFGLLDYGLERLNEWREKSLVEHGQAVDFSVELLEKMNEIDPDNTNTQYRLGQFQENADKHWLAALSFAKAAREPNLRQRAFTAAARCFQKSGHEAAAGSCFRRAREQALHDDDLRVLYTLARSLEDVGNFSEAKIYYDILLAWDPAYRDAPRRAARIDSGGESTEFRAKGETDYTGLTVKLLTPDTPKSREVDQKLHSVIARRSLELRVTDAERKCYDKVLSKFYGEENGIREKTKTQLGYSVESYIKYDFLLPEDEIKKELERVNTLVLLDGVSISRSLDIGAATGRWPRTFASQNIQAFGVDIEAEAIKYARQKLTSEDKERGYPVLMVADALSLPFSANYFCLLTCMMGTFAHLKKQNHKQFFAEAERVLRPGGVLLVSTWDVQCRHQAYLSMYSIAEKQMIDSNSLNQSELVQVGTQAGFKLKNQIPICLIPDVLSFELGIKELDAESLRQMVTVDLAARSSFPDMHGEMFLTLFEKP